MIRTQPQLTLFEFAVAGMKAQAEVDKLCEKPPKFDGETFDDKLDGPRLTKQLERVREFMLDRVWEYIVYPKDGLV